MNFFPWRSFTPIIKNRIMLFLHWFWHHLINTPANHWLFFMTKNIFNILWNIENDSHILFLNFWLKSNTIIFKHQIRKLKVLLFENFNFLIINYWIILKSLQKLLWNFPFHFYTNLIQTQQLHNYFTLWKHSYHLWNYIVNLLDYRNLTVNRSIKMFKIWNTFTKDSPKILFLPCNPTHSITKLDNNFILFFNQLNLYCICHNFFTCQKSVHLIFKV